jgi:hypothetical protein
MNPFTGADDRVTHFTSLLLWNNGTSSVAFSANNTITMKIVFDRPHFISPAETFGDQPPVISGLQTLNLHSGNNSSLSSLGVMPLADVGPSSNIIDGHVSLSSPTGGNSDHLKLVAAEITEAGLQHAVAVNLTRLDLTTTGLSLYHADIRTGLTGMNPFTGADDE